jgi:tetrapyrrole methylase family protein / MazG family protein
MNPDAAYNRFLEIVRRLRSPGGCPWDIEQTPMSVRANLIEEAYECVEAIDEGNVPNVIEELGDVFLVTTMIAFMFEQEGVFSVADVLETISEKLVRRHPHVFGEAEAADAEAVIRQWNDIKEKGEGRRKKDSALDGISAALPPLERAYKMQAKAAKLGFDWTDPRDVWKKLREEIDEAEEAYANGRPEDRDAMEEEIGDVFFSVANVSRFIGVDPSAALRRSVAKFAKRFRYVESGMKAEGRPMGPENFARMDRLWDDAKALEAGKTEKAERT